MQPDDPQPLPERAYWTMKARERDGSVSSDGSWSTAPTDAADWEEEPVELTHSPNADANLDLEESVATSNQRASEDAQSSNPNKRQVEDDEGIYRGRIEAVKLTGDPNIPRGEYTFIAPDIGPNGLIRVASEDLFKGARIVKSVGHIAARGFRDGKTSTIICASSTHRYTDDYMASQLILISHDKLAQYWETFGHVSFYQRVNIDELIKV
jgi:hypothetical protein